MKAGVIGHPVSHSKSPLIHQYWMREHSITGSYEAIDIHPDNLQDGVKKLIDQGYDGFNVTVPHKTNIIDLCDDIDDSAKNIAAVNTVVIKDGTLYGMNTDAFGFILNVKQAIPEITFKEKNVSILGAGGAARSVIYALLGLGVSRINLTNRTLSAAEDLKKMAPDIIHVVGWDQRSDIARDADLLVNTTSLGMSGKPPLEMDLGLLPIEAVVTDIVYAPLMTDLLKNAQSRGNKTVTGIGMLLHQARPAFKAWTGILPSISEELQRQVLS